MMPGRRAGSGVGYCTLPRGQNRYSKRFNSIYGRGGRWNILPNDTVVKETNKKLPLFGPQKVCQKALPAVRALHTYNIFISFRVFIIVQYMPAQLEVRKVRLWGSESIKRDYLPALSIHYNNVNFLINVIAVKFNCFFFMRN